MVAAIDHAYVRALWGEEATEELAPAWRRVRPLWLVLGLTVVTFGLYAIYWLFATWRELHQEWPGESMWPIWHVAAIVLIPGYGFYRLYEHFRSIRDLTDSFALPVAFSPSFCIVVAMATMAAQAFVFALPWAGMPVPLSLELAIVGLEGCVVMLGQAALNAGWQAAPRGAPPARVDAGEWGVLAAGATFLALIAFSRLG